MNEPLSEHAREDRAHFDRIATEYFRKDTRPAHRAARKLRLAQSLKVTGRADAGRLLEVGCGAGFTAEYLAGRYSRYVGVDYSEKLIEHARRANQRPDAEFLAADVHALDLDDAFDVILMIGLLHHLEDPADTLRSLLRLLAPGGWIVANEPQSGNRVVSWMRGVRKKVDRLYADEQLEYSRQEILEIFRSAGLERISVRPQGLLSTPLAEVAMPGQLLLTPISHLLCAVDRALEAYAAPMLFPLSWNLIAAGQRDGALDS